MNNLADIKRRIATVKQTRQITGAMETISVAKMRKSMEQLDQNRAYFELIERVVRRGTTCNDAELDELIVPPKFGKKLLIVVSSDKGLCGGFNHDILKFAESIIDDDTVVIPIGQTAFDKFKNTCEVDGDFSTSEIDLDYALSKRIAQKILSRYGKDTASVSIVYSKLDGHASWMPTASELLPLKTDGNDTNDVTDIELEPSPAEALRHLLPLYLAGMIYGAFVNSAASEHIARRTAMSASTKNADELIASLSVEYNRARQGIVTEQITEIIGSTKALKGVGGGND